MNVIPILLVCSLVLVVGSIVLFVFSAKQGDCHESDRLCLLPLEDDTTTRDADASAPNEASDNPTLDHE